MLWAQSEVVASCPLQALTLEWPLSTDQGGTQDMCHLSLPVLSHYVAKVSDSRLDEPSSCSTLMLSPKMVVFTKLHPETLVQTLYLDLTAVASDVTEVPSGVSHILKKVSHWVSLFSSCY